MDPILDQIRKVCSKGSRYFCLDVGGTLMFEITEEVFAQLKDRSSAEGRYWFPMRGEGLYDKEWHRMTLQMRIQKETVLDLARIAYSAKELQIIHGLGLTDNFSQVGSRSKP